jgi:hypothetical protein
MGLLWLTCAGRATADETESWWSRGYAVAAFGGPVTQRITSEIVTGTVTFNRGGFLAVTGSKELANLGAGFALRAQLLVAHRFDGLDYDEIALMPGIEYSFFPWSKRSPVSLEASVGPSYATSVPSAEHQASPNPTHWLNAVGLELSIAPSVDSHWAFVGRYHHRSSCFGLYGGNEDESTAFAAGVKYRF